MVKNLKSYKKFGFVTVRRIINIYIKIKRAITPSKIKYF